MSTFLVSASIALALSQTPAPVLTVLSVTPPDVGDLTQTCGVILSNTHTSKAIGWVLQPPGEPVRSRHTTDLAITPGAGVSPNATYRDRVACFDGVPEPVEVAGVLYEDGSIGGDRDAIEQRILSRRRKHAQGFRELAGLIAIGRIEMGSGATTRRSLTTMIDQSAGPEISPIVRAAAKMLLVRTVNALPQVAEADAGRVLRERLVSDLSAMAKTMDSQPIQKGVQ
jgi:hypothetical protein